MDYLGSNISEPMAEELGFYPLYVGSSGTVLRKLNGNFEQFLEYNPIDSHIKDKISEDYAILKDKDKKFLDRIRNDLENARISLKELIDEGKSGPIIEAKKKDIEHYESILGIQDRFNAK